MPLSSLRHLLRPILGKGYFRRPGLRWIARVVRQRYRPESILVRNRRLYLNPHDAEVSGELAIHGAYEQREVDLMLGEIGTGDTVVDVGAHIGYMTLLFSSVVGASGRVLSFEPDPTNRSYLERTVAELPEKNVTIHPIAAWRESAMLPWHRSGTNTGDHSLLPSEEREQSSEQVRAERLDDIIAPGTSIALLKMDVQGAEAAAFDGMGRILRENPPRTMLVELMPHLMTKGGEEGKM